MSARQEIAHLLEQWLQLTEAEGAAIQGAVWPALKRIQSHKAGLQKALTEAARKWAEEDSANGSPNAALQPFRTEVGRILSLLTRNGEALAAQLRRAEAEQETLDQAKRNLSKIEGSYVRSSPQTAWHSYS
jgi:DNA repair exonuclease SbcCD ATPase subunit